MEKFSNWRDKATGVAPFLQISDQQSVLKTVITVVLLPIRLPLLLIFSLVYILCRFLIPQATQSLQRYLLWIVLILLGVIHWDVQVSGVKKKTFADLKLFMPKAGSVVYSNFISPLDPMIFASLFKVIFIIPHPSSGKIAEYNILSCMKYALSIQDTGASNEHVLLEDIIKRAKATDSIVIFFGEGTTSNGRGLLSLPKLNNKFDTEVKIIPTGIKYAPQFATTPIPQLFLSWVWTMLYGCKIWSVRLRFGLPLLSKDIDASADEISASLCQVGRLKKLGDDLDIHAKKDFLKAQQSYK